MEYGKLVRDGIPRIIVENGGKPITRILADDEYTSALMAKLREETDEFIESGSLEEVCDILEVLRAVICNMGTAMEEVEALRQKKLSERGSFERRIYLERVE